MNRIVLAAVVLVILSASVMAQSYNIPPGSSIYIEKLPQDLDAYLKAEFVKQKVPLSIAGSLEAAEYVLTGTATEEERRKWHEGWLTTEKDKTAGSVSILRLSDKSLAWAGEAGDRSVWWGSLARGGHRKVAQRLVKDLKKYVKEEKKVKKS